MTVQTALITGKEMVQQRTSGSNRSGRSIGTHTTGSPIRNYRTNST